MATPIYRLFSEREHAQGFVEGKIRLSTFSICRAYESHGQGDKGEGSIGFHLDYVHAPAQASPEDIAAARRVGIVIDESCSNFTMANCSSKHVIPDAYLLSFAREYPSHDMRDTFGNHCVEIRSPASVFKAIDTALHRIYRVNFSDILPVTYSKRVFDARHRSPPHPAFLKPADGYEYQNELRMVWAVQTDKPLNYLTLNLGDLSAYARLL